MPDHSATPGSPGPGTPPSGTVADHSGTPGVQETTDTGTGSRSTLITTTFGRPAYEALAEAVATAKAGDPLRPVTVIVPTQALGVAARRWLAQAGIDGRPGIAGLAVQTLSRLAESVAGAQMAHQGRRPTTPPVLVGAIRGVLDEDPGRFAPVADNPRTAESLAAASAALARVPADRLETPPMGIVGEVIRVHRAARARLAAEYVDESEMLAAAGDALAGHDLPPLVVFLPERLSHRQQQFLAALGRHTDVTAIVGLSGSESDAAVLGSVAGPLGASPDPADIAEPIGDRVLCTTDAEDEVRSVVSVVAEHLASGTPGHRIAIVYPSAVPYARQIHEQLSQAGITCHGRGVQPAAGRRYGRAIRGLLGLGDRDFWRGEVMSWLDDAPVAGHEPRWDDISRRAGVVRGSDWAVRLGLFAEESEQQADQLLSEAAGHEDESAERAAARAERLRERAASACRLSSVIGSIQSGLGAPATSWAELGERLGQLWSWLFPAAVGGPVDHSDHDRITRMIGGLKGLDGVAGPASLTAAREIIELDLLRAIDRVGTIGTGVMVGSIADAAGLDLDLLCVVGMAEGSLPSITGEDPLLPENYREQTDGDLPTWRERQQYQHRMLLAAMAGAEETLLSFPRGDLRNGGVRVPSRWLMPTLHHWLGNDVQSTDWQSAHSDRVEVRDSFLAGLAHDTPASDQQWQQRRLLADPGTDLGEAAATATRATQIRFDRQTGVFTPFTGLVGSDPSLPDVGSSPTGLQTWFACPHRYFVRHVLGVPERDDPDEAIEMSAMDRGTLIHAVLERLVKQFALGPEGQGVSYGEPLLDFGEPWPQQARDGLWDILGDEFTKAEDHGLTGLPAPWQRTKQIVRYELAGWIDRDNTLRAEGSWRPKAAEARFEVAARLPAGTDVAFRGFIDRVDEATDGTLRVIDYKTGKDDNYRALGPDDPTRGGSLLQLPIYALGARDQFGDCDVDARYWFIDRRRAYPLHGYRVTPEVMAESLGVIEVAVDGIRQGLFPPRPISDSGGYDCPVCAAGGFLEQMTTESFRALVADSRLSGLNAVIGGGE